METMSAKERVVRTLEGKPVDRVPCMCMMMEVKTVNEFMGKPFMSRILSDETMLNIPGAKFILDKWGVSLSKYLFRPNLIKTLHRRNVGQAEMGFDAIWAHYDDQLIMLDSKTMASSTGAIFDIIPDGAGNMTYMFKCPGFQTPADYDAWPYWPDTDDVAQRVYKYFKKLVGKYGERTCICGNGYFYGLQESMNMAIGIDKVSVWIKKYPAYVKRYLDLIEELLVKTHDAMIDAGVPVMFRSDDFAYKTGPFMNPKMVEDVFGERYKRIFKRAHDRGAKVILHSCGDNTKLFDTFISWGVDGLHAYETTSNVDINNEKKIHGNAVTIIGGMGIDYMLTERSTDEEVVAQVRKLIRELGPDGRFIVAPANSVDTMPAHKLQLMLDAVKKYGKYPINI